MEVILLQLAWRNMDGKNDHVFNNRTASVAAAKINFKHA
jgi:hypothetical protein